LEAFNLPINWQNGKIPGPKTKFKTTKAVLWEHEEEAYNIWRLCLEQKEQLRKVTIAQQMVEKYYKDHKEEKLQDIPEEYQRHVQVFSEKEAECFPPSWEWDHCISLKPDTPETIDIKMFSLAQECQDAIHNWVKQMLAKKFISRSDLQYGHATFTVPKKDSTYWIVQDYQPVNKYTRKDTTPLPNIQEAIEGLGDKVLFLKYDIHEGYNNIQIIPEDRWKTAFKTPDRLFKPNVMLFGLQGAPGTFSRMITVNIAPMYHKFLQNWFKHYMDDCLIAIVDGELQLHRQMNQTTRPLQTTFVFPETIQMCIWTARSGLLGCVARTQWNYYWP
jgi:Reverse transcriptase (RNA-dependent DNA polymerase)